MTKVYITMEPSKQKPGFYSPTGFHLEEPENWVYMFTVDDPKEFIKHMQRYSSLPSRGLNRQEYEKICVDLEVIPLDDSEIEFDDSLENGDFSMGHYHTDEENRKFVIQNRIHQLRFFGIKKMYRMK